MTAFLADLKISGYGRLQKLSCGQPIYKVGLKVTIHPVVFG